MPDRIDPTELEDVAELIFGEKRLTGPAIAGEMGESRITVWSWLHRRGMPAERAEKMATVVEAYAMKLLRAAAKLRRAANTAREPEAEAVPA